MRYSAGRITRLVMSTTAVSLVVLAAMLVANLQEAGAQDAKKAAAPSGQAATSSSLVARGAYIVNDVAMCPTCHTPKLPNGELDPSRWLSGASEPYMPAHPTADWPTITPRIGGLTPTSDEAMVKLLTTTIWTDGKQLRDPMPKFHMTKADAEAVVAYLKSLTTSH